jgi:hypothetical protein
MELPWSFAEDFGLLQKFGQASLGPKSSEGGRQDCAAGGLDPALWHTEAGLGVVRQMQEIPPG